MPAQPALRDPVKTYENDSSSRQGRFRHSLVFVEPAPKARPIPAWGNAPGLSYGEDQGLKARSIIYEPGFQPSDDLNPLLPGALPQAGMDRAFGPSFCDCSRTEN